MRDFKAQRGYITIAQDSGDLSYIRMAYALALSLKATQSEVSGLTIMTTPGTTVPPEYAHAFDEIIEMPWSDDAEEFEWKIQNKWKVFYWTPYHETVLVDADMLFPEDVSHWWEILSSRNMWVTTRPVNYKGEYITPGPYRQDFYTNNLPMAYTAFAYFKQSAQTAEFFDLLQYVMRRWGALYVNYSKRRIDDEWLAELARRRHPLRFKWYHFLRDFPEYASGDLAFALTMKMLGFENDFTSDHGFPTFTHMKMADQGFSRIESNDWTEVLPCTLRDDLSIQVGHYRQRYPFHYVNKDWITDEMMAQIEDAANG